MHRLLLTLPTPADNLALDEALLDWAEAIGPQTEFLRVWESLMPMVVVGRSSRVGQEVNQQACADRGIPILRRSSGGAAIVAGPGCLMYAVILSYELRPQLRDIRQAHEFVLGRLAEALKPHIPAARLDGTSDLVLDDAASAVRKFSGNSLRAKRTHFLYHGTLLYEFDLSLIAECLRIPPRQPDYRQSRSHAEFVTNLPLSQALLEQSLIEAWPTTGELDDWPRDRVAQLVEMRFSRDDWNLQFGHDEGTS